MPDAIMLGLGNATGMFYHAPAGTALPATATTTIPSTWTEVGNVTDAGITLATSKTTQNFKNWANQIKRVLVTDHSETIQSPLMDTSAEALKVVVGASNVTTTAAAAQHGAQISVNLSDGALPPEEAFLWVMKDGDAMIMIGCTKGQVTAVDNVNFAPGNVINWTPTITALDDGFVMLVDDGQTTGG